MLYQDKAPPAEYWAGLEYAKDRGWLGYHGLAARVPDLDLGQHLVLRDETGWQLTDAGREILSVAESSAPQPVAPEVSAVSAPQPDALTALRHACSKARSRHSDRADARGNGASTTAAAGAVG
ncbi:hypothetical protein QA635_08475 [Bradyrhizobium brasilense]|uniref:hypothetical protein n=1 Tax=Bradyrhizobium brasilense TaxID=1419277 RepID=UPI0024B0D1AE|nr:hypothetical protein [Bradyrhizobium australafricanum]WFU34434.1 hypothetical protein QA635_08475 [Bradyrhizobium australafricanum]